MLASWTRKQPAGERTADQPHVALRHPEGVADVARAVEIYIADHRVRERCHAALAQTDGILRHNEGVANVDYSIAIHVATELDDGTAAIGNRLNAYAPIPCVKQGIDRQ